MALERAKVGEPEKGAAAAVVESEAPLEERVIYDKQPIDRSGDGVRAWTGARPSCLG
jgi:hypothetical protein